MIALPSNPPAETVAAKSEELQKLFLDNTAKLGVLAAGLGISADADLKKIEAQVRLHIEAYVKLLGGSAEVLLSMQEAPGGYWVRPATIERLKAAVDFARNVKEATR